MRRSQKVTVRFSREIDGPEDGSAVYMAIRCVVRVTPREPRYYDRGLGCMMPGDHGEVEILSAVSPNGAVELTEEEADRVAELACEVYDHQEERTL